MKRWRWSCSFTDLRSWTSLWHVTSTRSSYRRTHDFSRVPSTSRYPTLEVLRDGDVDVFRTRYFKPERPVILSGPQFRDNIPAFQRWFYIRSSGTCMNEEYLKQYAAEVFVPLELTQPRQTGPITATDGPGKQDGEVSFRSFRGPFGLFLDWMRTPESLPQTTRLYLAQCQLLDLPPVLREDFPTPSIVSQAGKGDIYDINLWIGLPPTYTPLHRDPNSNVFVQLAGRKIVRLLSPADGMALFARVRQQIGRRGNRAAATFRGEEMMQGQERALLERVVWDDASPDAADLDLNHHRYETCLNAGDGLFIPKGWWHSIKGVGKDVTASVNWWFL